MVTKGLPTDDAALLRAAATDADAFEAFYRAWAPALNGWLRRQVADAETASDLTAEAFAQALVSLPSFRGRRPGSGSAWLWGIARNLVRQHYRTARLESVSRRRLGIEQRSYGGEEVDEVVARTAAAARAAEIAAALDGLSPEQRSALQLRVVDDLDFGAVSEYLRISQPAARMRVSRALALLRSRFREGVT